MKLIAFLLVILSILPSTVSQAAPPQEALFSQDKWMGIYSGDDKIGYSHAVVRTKERLEVFEENKIKMTILGADQNIETKSGYVLDGYSLESFEFSMNAGTVNLEARGKREGKELKMQVSSVSGNADIDFPLSGEPLISPILFKWLSEQKPEVGKSYKAALFDPALVLTGAEPEKLEATLTIEDKEKIEIPIGSFEAYRVKMLFMGSPSTIWITEQGEVVKEISSLGLVSVRETKEKALGEALSNLDIAEKTAIESNVLIDDPRNLKLLRVKVGGIESAKSLDLEDNNRQIIKDGVVEIRRDDVSTINAYALPYVGEQYREFLEHTVLIQSDDPRIRKKSEEIIDGEKSSLGAAKEINDWVYENLKKAPTVSIPNALDVLQTAEGDCNEHAALFTALARASGIPTKMALGVVYLDGKFYYHAWNEVFVGRWITVDPTFGQFPADASHIKFIEGDLSRASEIASLVGKINLDIEEAL